MLASVVNVAALGSILFRLTINTIDADAEIQVIVDRSNGTQSLAVMTETWSEPGYFALAFSRGDKDDTTIVNATITFVNRSILFY